ncbi:hypothetical protein M3Y94_01174500 [Aphelenchoides besseyi]|nr:hypothetical protein M3Y94_01174500 [Aphelenchoides besseyi]KAI6228185.1 hypothetical protein M3Y95_00595700 [Aphelenchoides besseyi]
MSSTVVIVDCNACNWGALSEKWPNKQELLKRMIAAVIVYANTHLSLSVNNNLMVIGAGTPLNNRVLYTSEFSQKNVRNAEILDLSIRSALQAAAEGQENFSRTNYSSSLAIGMCYLQRLKRESKNTIGRMVIINLSEESFGEQARLMNLFLSAQQLDLKIHVCSLEKTNPLLRQACDISAGVHRQVEKIEHVLQFLIRYALGNSKTAQNLFVLRNHERIDYQTACYCHNKTLSLGFVCSVCLAVHCQRLSKCAACGTEFSNRTVRTLH